MGDTELGAAMVPVTRVETATRDMEVVAGLINQLYVEHRARFRCADPAKVDGGVRSVTAGPLGAGLVRYLGVDYHAQADGLEDLIALVTIQGTGRLTTRREEVTFATGDVLLDPVAVPYTAEMNDSAFALVRIPQSAVCDLAEEHTGLPATDLRFESMTAVPSVGPAVLAQTATFICHQLIGSGVTEIGPLITQEMTRLAAAALLKTFPNTAMNASYIAGPGRVPPSAVRRAAAFIQAQAEDRVALADVAAEAGVTARALQYAFRRYYGTTPMGYLRRVRLERAHRELQAADPTTGATVAATARKWGWAKPSQFAHAYRREYGQPPSQTLRT